MPLQLLPAGDADMYRSAVIEHNAYSPLASSAVLFPGPFRPGVLDYRAEDFKKDAKEPNTFWFKVVDTELEGDKQIIALSKWYKTRVSAIPFDEVKWLTTRRRVIYDASNPPRPSPPREFPPLANIEACTLLFGELAKLRPRHIGDRHHAFLAMLYTDPKHQGRGAGGLLLQKFIEEARQKGLPAYLNSSERAHKLYLKHGFRDLEEVVTDFSPWGMTEPHRVWAMIRETDVRS